MTTAAQTTAGNRPIPMPDAASQPFFDAAKQHKLLIKYCPHCNRYLAPAVEVCDACFEPDVEWREASGKGSIFSFVVVHQVIHPAFAQAVPYNVAIIELAEGPRINSNIVGVPDSDIKVNAPVEVVFEDLNEEITVPKFRMV